MPRYRVALFVVILSIISGCAASRSKSRTGNGETHFLRKCECDADCESLGEAFVCVTGFCRDKGEIDSALAQCLSQTDSQSRCTTSAVVIDQDVGKVEKIDLLFVVDNSKSMEQEQKKLRDQIPTMIEVLTTGDKTPYDSIENKDFPPVRDLHLAVVSSDMGLPGLTAQENPDATGACNGTGDDGNFLNDPSQAMATGFNCPGVEAGGYPIFLEHIRDEREDTSVTRQRAEATADAFECIATLGTEGCGYEMPLESALKALWPSQPASLTEEHQKLGISFLAGSQGRGDNEHKSFLRGTPYHPTESDKLSLLAIIVVTDEDDCSAGAQGDLQFLSRNASGGDRQDDTLGCYYDTINDLGNKYSVERYIEGFKALRPEFPDLVVFAAIAGIPPEIEEDADGNNDITPEERRQYYDQVSNHRLMQETPNPDTKNLEYSCQHETRSGVFDTQAFPARRLTEMARGFGANGIVRSICADDFTPAMKAIIDVIASKIGGVCLPRAYTRDTNGMIACDVIWTMPPDWSCDDAIYLFDPPPDKPQYRDGRKRCVVNQIPVINPNTDNPAEALDFSRNEGLGWYYDDFSPDMQRTCKMSETTRTIQRISFSLTPGMNGQHADPPAGVSVDLDCLQQFATWSDIQNQQNGSSESSNAPTSEQLELLGTPCEDASRDMCPLPPVDPGEFFCSEGSDLCELRCRGNDDCPAGWICDRQQNADGTYLNQSQYPICVNPICDLPEGGARNCGNTDVGEACTPSYGGAFDSNIIYIETNSPECETRICGVFGYQGNPSDRIGRFVTTEDKANYDQERIFCTCRCRASDPDVSTCTCPDGFECSEDILSLAQPTLAGGYCVRKGILEEYEY